MAHAAQLNILEQNCPIQVEHDRKRRQFTVRLNGCHDRAVLLYEYVGKKIVDLQHTEVPDAYRGRGIAKHLAKSCNPAASLPSASHRGEMRTTSSFLCLHEAMEEGKGCCYL
ncbi:protein NATD1 isoform 1-T1 [Macrochelys suwanniensis]